MDKCAGERVPQAPYRAMSLTKQRDRQRQFAQSVERRRLTANPARHCIGIHVSEVRAPGARFDVDVTPLQRTWNAPVRRRPPIALTMVKEHGLTPPGRRFHSCRDRTAASKRFP